MRSTCLGARSGRSLMVMRPYLVSRKTVFCGSSAAAEAELPAKASANARVAADKIRITGCLLEPLRPGEAGFQAAQDAFGHEVLNVAAHGSDLAHERGGDGANHRRRRQKHRLDVRRKQ